MMSPVVPELSRIPPDEEAGDRLVERAHLGARLMTMRGMVMRLISVASNFVLLTVVSPADLGLLAVVRGMLGVMQFAAELGVERAFLRRADDPSRREYAALAGVQTIVVLLLLGIGLLAPSLVLGFGALDRRWLPGMLAVIATMMMITLGTGAKVRLERALHYERIAIVDVLNTTLLNVGLLVFAFMHRFALGVFVTLGTIYVVTNALLFLWSPGPRPSLRLDALRGVARESAGYMATSGFTVARDFATPVLVANLFGLSVAGLWAFAVRVAQLLNVTFDGYRRALIPAAARLSHDQRTLRQLSTNTLRGAASLAIPFAAMAVVWLPMVEWFWPRWSDAILLAQVYVVGFALAGVVGASFEPVAVAMRGALAALAEQASATAGAWVGLLAVWASGGRVLAWAVIPMTLAPIVSLVALTTRAVRPRWDAELTRQMAGAAVALALYLGGAAMGAPSVLAALVATAVVLIVSRPRRIIAQLLFRRAELRAQSAAANGGRVQ